MRIDDLEHRLKVAKAQQDQPAAPSTEETIGMQTADLSVQVKQIPRVSRGISEEAHDAHIHAIAHALATARHSIEEAQGESTPWRRFRAWRTGTAITAAWESVHEAEAELVEIESEEAARASLPHLFTWIQDVMPSGEQKKRYEEQLTDYMDGKKSVDRTVVRQAYQGAIYANNEKHANLRAFRNQLLVAVLTLALLLVTIGAWHAANTSFVSLCSSEAPAAELRCLTGPGRTGFDVFAVELIGALGGLLSIAIGFGRTRVPRSRYDPRWLQVLLKPFAGAATALIGVLLVQSEILIAPVSGISESLLLAYAALFGFSQQLFTRFVDKHGDKLLGEEETSEAGGSTQR